MGDVTGGKDGLESVNRKSKRKPSSPAKKKGP